MSYILDALRRADAERERGAVPGLHAQNIPADTEPAARNHRPLVWAAGGAGALLVAVVVVLVFAPWQGTAVPDRRAPLGQAPELNPSPRDNAPVTTAQGETPAAHPGALEPAALPVEPPIARANTQGGQTSTDRATGPRAARQGAADAAALAQTTRLAARAASGRVGFVEPKAAAAKGTRTLAENSTATASTATPVNTTPYAAATAAAAAAAAADPQVDHYGPAAATGAQAPVPAGTRAQNRPSANPTPGTAVPGVNDLPQALRAQLPRLTPGGAIYSDAPSARMLILNGQIYHEGDKPAADTVLEQIKHKSAVLNFRGQRYEIAF